LHLSLFFIRVLSSSPPPSLLYRVPFSYCSHYAFFICIFLLLERTISFSSFLPSPPRSAPSCFHRFCSQNYFVSWLFAVGLFQTFFFVFLLSNFLVLSDSPLVCSPVRRHSFRMLFHVSQWTFCLRVWLPSKDSSFSQPSFLCGCSSGAHGIALFLIADFFFFPFASGFLPPLSPRRLLATNAFPKLPVLFGALWMPECFGVPEALPCSQSILCRPTSSPPNPPFF